MATITKTTTKRSTATKKSTSNAKGEYPPKSDMILELANMEDSIHIKVINLTAKRNKSEEQNILKNLQSLNDNALEEVYYY